MLSLYELNAVVNHISFGVNELVNPCSSMFGPPLGSSSTEEVRSLVCLGL